MGLNVVFFLLHYPTDFDRKQRFHGSRNYFVGGYFPRGSKFEKTSELKENRILVLIVSILHLGNATLHLGNTVLNLP
jgi:hypothetical protein